jgi:hypothetical protein
VPKCLEFLTQVHNQPTREGNLLDLVFVSNPTLVKSSTNVPGISDHDIIISDMETRVYHQKSKPRKCFIYTKANWTAIHKDLSYLNNNIETMTKEGNNVNILWKTFKTKLFESLEKNTPSKEIKGNKNIPWIRRNEKKMIKKK